jgi:hypothetical protein
MFRIIKGGIIMFVDDQEIKDLGLDNIDVYNYLVDIQEKYGDQMDYEMQIALVMAMKKFE